MSDKAVVHVKTAGSLSHAVQTMRTRIARRANICTRKHTCCKPAHIDVDATRLMLQQKGPVMPKHVDVDATRPMLEQEGAVLTWYIESLPNTMLVD